MSEQIQKDTVAGVTFDCTETGTLDESEIDKEETNLSDHYMYGSGDDKSDYTYPVVGADGCLYRGNVDSAWGLGCRGQCSDAEKHDERLKKLGKQFEDNPIPEDAYKFEKHAEIAKVDSDRQVVVGPAMVPNEIDAVGDFEREATIRQLSESYMERMATGESKSGVMHTKFPDEDITHVENRVLEQSQDIGGETYPAGTWVVGKKVSNDSLWNSVESGAITGFSIGGYIHDAERYAPEDVPAGVSGTYDGDIREVTAATIEEISLVDSPAVPRATIQVAKSAADSNESMIKADPRLTAGTDEATEYLVEERGHDPDDARQLAEYLNGETKATPDESGDGPSWFAKAKAFFSGSDTGERTEKVGATLSQSNRESLMEIHDSALTVLQDAGYGPMKSTFVDDPRVDYDGEKAQQSDEPAESGAEIQTENSMSEYMDAEDYDAIANRIAEKMSDTDGDESEKSAHDDEQDDGLEQTVEQLADNQEEIVERLDAMANAQGVSQQKARSTGSDDDGTWGKNSPFAPAGAGGDT